MAERHSLTHWGAALLLPLILVGGALCAEPSPEHRLLPGRSLGGVELNASLTAVHELLGPPRTELPLPAEGHRALSFTAHGSTLTIGSYRRAPHLTPRVVFLRASLRDANLTVTEPRPLPRTPAGNALGGSATSWLAEFGQPMPSHQSYVNLHGQSSADYPTRGLRFSYAVTSGQITLVEVYPPEPAANTTAPDYYRIVPGLGLAGVRLGLPLRQLTELHGTPLDLSRSLPPSADYNYHLGYHEFKLRLTQPLDANATVTEILAEPWYPGASEDGAAIARPLTAWFAEFGVPEQKGVRHNQAYAEWSSQGLGITFDTETKLVTQVLVFRER